MSIQNISIDGTGNFYDTTINNGEISYGNFYDNALNTGTISVSSIFEGSSRNEGSVNTVVFKGGAVNTGTVEFATFQDSAYNLGDVQVATFKDNASNSGTVQTATFKDTTNNYGTVAVSAAFQDTSNNAGTVVGEAQFAEGASNIGTGTFGSSAVYVPPVVGITGVEYFSMGAYDGLRYYVNGVITTPIPRIIGLETLERGYGFAPALVGNKDIQDLLSNAGVVFPIDYSQQYLSYIDEEATNLAIVYISQPVIYNNTYYYDGLSSLGSSSTPLPDVSTSKPYTYYNVVSGVITQVQEGNSKFGQFDADGHKLNTATTTPVSVYDDIYDYIYMPGGVPQPMFSYSGNRFFTTGAYSYETGLRDGTILTPTHAEDDSELFYTALSGNVSLANGCYSTGVFVDGVIDTGYNGIGYAIAEDERLLCVYAGGLFSYHATTLFGGAYYVDGALSDLDSTGSGDHQGVRYEGGVIYTGYSSATGLFYVDGYIYTGEYSGYLYQDGYLANGVYNNMVYVDGIYTPITNGSYTDPSGVVYWFYDGSLVADEAAALAAAKTALDAQAVEANTSGFLTDVYGNEHWYYNGAPMPDQESVIIAANTQTDEQASASNTNGSVTDPLGNVHWYYRGQPVSSEADMYLVAITVSDQTAYSSMTNGSITDDFGNVRWYFNGGHVADQAAAIAAAKTALDAQAAAAGTNGSLTDAFGTAHWYYGGLPQASEAAAIALATADINSQAAAGNWTGTYNDLLGYSHTYVSGQPV